jgi:hypothetical protein
MMLSEGNISANYIAGNHHLVSFGKNLQRRQEKYTPFISVNKGVYQSET